MSTISDVDDDAMWETFNRFHYLCDTHRFQKLLARADLVALGREFLWYADWTAHAAQDLGIEDPFGQMPHEYAYRLRQREAAKSMPINQGGKETQDAMKALLG